jgi:hypothetical protein
VFLSGHADSLALDQIEAAVRPKGHIRPSRLRAGFFFTAAGVIIQGTYKYRRPQLAKVNHQLTFLQSLQFDTTRSLTINYSANSVVLTRTSNCGCAILPHYSPNISKIHFS